MAGHQLLFASQVEIHSVPLLLYQHCHNIISIIHLPATMTTLEIAVRTERDAT